MSAHAAPSWSPDRMIRTTILALSSRVSDGGAGSADFVDDVERAIDSDPTPARGVYKTVDFVRPI